MIHGNKSQYAKAMEHYNRALALQEQAGSEADAARTLGNIANLYHRR